MASRQRKAQNSLHICTMGRISLCKFVQIQVNIFQGYSTNINLEHHATGHKGLLDIQALVPTINKTTAKHRSDLFYIMIGRKIK